MIPLDVMDEPGAQIKARIHLTFRHPQPLSSFVRFRVTCFIVKNVYHPYPAKEIFAHGRLPIVVAHQLAGSDAPQALNLSTCN